MPFCTKCGKDVPAGSSFCLACGAPVQESAPAPGGAAPPVPTAPIAPPRKSNAPKIVAITCGSLLVLVFAVFMVGVLLVRNRGGSSAPKAEDSSNDSSDMSLLCVSVATAYLKDMKDGGSTYPVFWKPGSKVVQLYDVHSYTELTHGELLQPNRKPFKVPRVYYKFEIESSTKGGIPVRKHWAVELEPSTKSILGKQCAIVNVEEME